MAGKLQEKLLLYNIRVHQDKEAFGLLYDAYIKSIYRFVFFKISNKEEAEDLTSDIFLKTWIYITDPQRKEVGSFRGLMYQIARNVLIDRYREHKHRVEVPLEEGEEVAAEGVDMQSNIMQQQEQERILSILKKLKQEYQDIIFLRYIEALSIAEIAKILGKKNTAVRVTLYRAMRVLKRFLYPEKEEEHSRDNIYDKENEA